MNMTYLDLPPSRGDLHPVRLLGHGAAEVLQPLAQLRSLELVAEGALAA